jgi:Domain of unknown function (DUF3385)
MRALGQVVSATGMVVRPYFHHPKLLDLLLTALRRGDRAAAGLRTEALRTFGLLGALDPVKLRICSGRAVDTLRRPLVAVQRCNTAAGDGGSSSSGGSSSNNSDSSELGDTADADAADSAAEGSDAISAAAAVDVTVPVVGGHADAAVFGAAAGVSVEQHQHQQQQQHEQQHDDSHVWGSAVEPWWLQRGGSGRAAGAGGGVTVPDFGEELVEGRSALQCRYTTHLSCYQAYMYHVM